MMNDEEFECFCFESRAMTQGARPVEQAAVEILLNLLEEQRAIRKVFDQVSAGGQAIRTEADHG